MGIKIPVQIVKAEEPWVVLTLSDGSVIRARISIAEVTREDGVWDQAGDPVYHFKAHQMVSVTAPEVLRRKQSAI